MEWNGELDESGEERDGATASGGGEKERKEKGEGVTRGKKEMKEEKIKQKRK